jgi:hypothetical protein
MALEIPIRIGNNHGYRIEGDTAYLNADLPVAAEEASSSAPAPFALQLWACDGPYRSGSLSGVKVAEVPVAPPVAVGEPGFRLEAATFARIPAGRREYSMVLVLASSAPGAPDKVYDFANYPNRELFQVPYLEGDVGYSIDGDSVLLTVGRVVNPRPTGHWTGLLSLELWAMKATASVEQPEGMVLATAGLGQVGGGGSLDWLSLRTAFSQPPAGHWQLALLLREGTEAAGIVTRDSCNFPVPFASRLDVRGRPSHAEIELAAYFRSLAGHGPADPIRDWLEAEQTCMASQP